MNRKKSLFRRLLPWLIVIAALAALVIFVFIPIYSEHSITAGRETRVLHYDGDGQPITLENDALLFEMDSKTSQFRLTNKANGQVWYSNPEKAQEDPIAGGVNKELLSSTLTLTYMSSGGEVEMNNYRNSIVNQNYRIEREDDQTVRVDYAVGKIEREYLIPEAITEADFNAMVENLSSLDKKKIKGFYSLMDADKLAKDENREELIESYAGIETTPIYLLKAETTAENKEKIEGYFRKAGYSREDYDRDMQLILKRKEKKTFCFNASIRYRLEGNDLVVSVPYSELTYDSDHPLVYISVLPMFGAAGTEDSGFIFLPEGSGAVINYNNGKINHPNYYANFYGWDYGMERTEAGSETENAFCVFGMSRDEGSFVCMIEGASSYGGIYADISGRKNSYNYVFSKYNLIHYGRFKLSGRTNELIPMYENDIPDDEIVQRYRFIAESGYVPMAETYGSYLRELPEYRQAAADENIPVNVEAIGAINKTVPKLGLPVDSVVAVTTFDQAGSILKEIGDAGIDGVSLRMTGWSNGGVRQRVLSSVHTLGELGGDAGMKRLISTAKAQNADLYFDGISCFAYHSGLFNGFVPTMHAAKFTTRELVRLYPYSIITYQQATWSDDFYLVKPTLAASYTDNLINALSKREAAGVAFRDLGNLLSADYNYKDTVTREQVKAMHVASLQSAREKGLKISIKEGNDYALPYADLVTDINLTGGGYAMLDESVPFLEIAIHGLKNYTGEPINLAGDYMTSLLECAEYGAGLNFSFMMEDPSILQDSAYSCYTGANWDRWKDEVIPMIIRYRKETAGLNSLRITGHEILTDEVRVTTYEDGTRIYVNYGHEAAEVDGREVPARDYLIERGDGQ